MSNPFNHAALRDFTLYEYALQHPNGQFYTGRAGDGWLGAKHEAFTYTEQGAHRQITVGAWRNHGMKVVRIA